ncbi:hypothetical protein HDU98_001274, partial [Podochytrium sp. JEL0797]
CCYFLPCSSEDWLAGFPALVETPLMQEQNRAQIRDFNSTTVFIRPTLSSSSPPDCSTCFIFLSKIFGHIVDFTKQYSTNTSPTGTSSIHHSPSPTIDLDLRLSLLETSLVSWYASLPEPIRTPLSPTMTPPDHFCAIANLQIYYHLCMMILHKPNLMHTLRTYPPKTHHTTIPHTRSFQTCHRAAQQITRLVYTLRHNNNPQWTRIGAPLMYCYAVFQGALVFLIAGQVCCGGGGGLEAARVHVVALRGLARDWALAGKLGETLSGLIEVAREAALNGESACGEGCLRQGQVMGGGGGRGLDVGGYFYGHEDSILNGSVGMSVGGWQKGV